jgi:hypothetical protein
MGETNGKSERGDLVIDELDEKLAAFNAFRKSDGAAADRILGELGANDAVDRDIVLQLAGKRPLGHPERFDEAHAMAIRSLEVLDRNGARSVTTRLPGPLDAVAAYLIQLVTRFIVSNHQKSLADSMRKLYARREANCLPDDPARRRTRLVVHRRRRRRRHLGDGQQGRVVRARWRAVGVLDRRQLGDHPRGGGGPAPDRLDHREAVPGALRDDRPLRRSARRLGQAVRVDRDDHPDHRLGAGADHRRHRLPVRRIVT